MLTVKRWKEMFGFRAGMAVQNKVLYAFRGWIAFVAFMDLGCASRCFIEKKSFFGKGDVELNESNYTALRMLAMYFILKALALIHCTLYIHYKPVVSMGFFSMLITIVLYGVELFYRTTTLNFYLIFPSILNFITIVGLIYIPVKLRIWSPQHSMSDTTGDDDENLHLLRQVGVVRRGKKNKKE